MAQRVGPVKLEDDDHDNDRTLVDVPQHAIGFVTGKNGNFLRTIEEEWCVIMSLPPPSGRLSNSWSPSSKCFVSLCGCIFRFQNPWEDESFDFDPSLFPAERRSRGSSSSSRTTAAGTWSASRSSGKSAAARAPS